MIKVPENSAPAKTFHELQALGVRDASSYLKSLNDILEKTEISLTMNALDHLTREMTLDGGINLLISYYLKILTKTRQRLIVIGNGGSAGIAMHTLADYANAGGFKTMDLYGPALLTCMSNDYGYENVFSKPIEMFAEKGDVLFAISSSGKSPNILSACESALAKKCVVVTFSGFGHDNPLRKSGHMNFYVPSTHYGFVELTHQILIHSILDLFVRREVYEKAREAIG